MVGLSVVLEGHPHNSHRPKRSTDAATPPTNNISNCCSSFSPSTRPQVISKTSMSAVVIHSARLSVSSPSPSSFPPPAFLQNCFLCNAKLLPGKDIYMYKGDRAFCSEECRYRQIFMDDQEEMLQKENCSMAAIKPPATASSTPSSHSSSASSRNRRASRNHRAGGFAY